MELLAAGAKVNAKNVSGNTPLHEAAFTGKEETVQILLAAGANVLAKNKAGNTPLQGMPCYSTLFKVDSSEVATTSKMLRDAETKAGKLRRVFTEIPDWLAALFIWLAEAAIIWWVWKTLATHGFDAGYSFVFLFCLFLFFWPPIIWKIEEATKDQIIYEHSFPVARFAMMSPALLFLLSIAYVMLR